MTPPSKTKEKKAGPGDLKVEDLEPCAWLSASKSKDTRHCLHKTLLRGKVIFKTNKEIT